MQFSDNSKTTTYIYVYFHFYRVYSDIKYFKTKKQKYQDLKTDNFENENVGGVQKKKSHFDDLAKASSQ